MEDVRLVRTVVSTHCLTQALAFYSGFLGLEVHDHGDGMAALSMGSAQLMLHERATTPTDAGVALCFSVGDVVDLTERWQARGGTVVSAVEVKPWGELMSVVRDPDGHIVCLVQAQ